MKNLVYLLLLIGVTACMKGDDLMEQSRFSDAGVTSLCVSPSGATIPCIYLSDWEEYESDKPVWKYVTYYCRAQNDRPGILCKAGPNGDCRHLFSCLECANCAEY